jgi:hypothetical protein
MFNISKDDIELPAGLEVFIHLQNFIDLFIQQPAIFYAQIATWL